MRWHRAGCRSSHLGALVCILSFLMLSSVSSRVGGDLANSRCAVARARSPRSGHGAGAELPPPLTALLPVSWWIQIRVGLFVLLK